MNREISLTVSIQIQGAEFHGASDRLLEDPGFDGLRSVVGQPWQRNVDRDQFHSASESQETAPYLVDFGCLQVAADAQYSRPVLAQKPCKFGCIRLPNSHSLL
jgi:hypothetical protein